MLKAIVRVQAQSLSPAFSMTAEVAAPTGRVSHLEALPAQPCLAVSDPFESFRCNTSSSAAVSSDNRSDCIKKSYTMQGFAVCPNLPFGLCPRLWDEAHVPEADEDDARLYSSDSAGSNPRAAWLLILAGIISLAALVPSGGTSAGRRSRVCGSAALLGLLVGLYLALQLFPAQFLLQVSRAGCLSPP